MESVFIEIFQKNSKNLAVGSLCRHPCMQNSEFNDEYLKPLSEKLISENKEVILHGDFNIDLLKCDSNRNVPDFLDIIYSSNLVPTSIDNIFIFLTQNSKKDLYKQNFKHFSSKKFITDLEKVNWDNILNVSEGNVDQSFQNFSDKITDTDILDKP